MVQVVFTLMYFSLIINNQPNISSIQKLLAVTPSSWDWDWSKYFRLVAYFIDFSINHLVFGVEVPI